MPKFMGKRCPYSDLYEKVFSISSQTDSSNITLPIDSHGACIFHSQDLEWKRQNDFKGHFIKLVQLLNADKEQSSYDFSEFRFVGNELKTKPDSKHLSLHIKDLIFNKQAYFIGASFMDAFELEGVVFKDGANFSESTFVHNLKVSNSSFRGLACIKTQFNQFVLFTNVELMSYILFEKAKFTGPGGGYVVKFDDSKFDGLTDFSGAIFNLRGRESSVGFRNVQFESFTDFTSTKFHNQIVFSDVSFGSATEFTDTLFDTVTSSERYLGAAVEFNRIEVMTTGTLNFKSTDPMKKMFNHDIVMSFKEDPAGMIHFENVNFSKFTAESRDRLTQLAKFGKVEIGSGCIKYRFQTDIRKISVCPNNTALILEICQTFTNYFAVSNGLNLGFEIVERNKTEVHFFYFTDENISAEDFYKTMAKTEQHLWNLLSMKPDLQLLVYDEPTGTELSPIKKNAIINTVDVISALLGTFFRAGTRIALGTWKETDTKALLDAIKSDDSETDRRAQNLHRVLADKYTGQRLFELVLQQNKQLTLLKEKNIFLEGKTSGVNETVELFAAKGNKPTMGNEANKSTEIKITTGANSNINVARDVSDSTIKQTTQALTEEEKRDILKDELEKIQLPVTDIGRIFNIIREEQEHVKDKNYTPKINNWIADMVVKAATGGWAVSVGAAGGFLANALSKYFGF